MGGRQTWSRIGAAVVMAAASSCTGAEVERPEAPPSSVASADVPPEPTPPPPAKARPTASGCRAIAGRVPSEGQITFVRDDKIVAASPDGEPETCLVDLERTSIAPTATPLSWNARGDAVIVDDVAVFAGTRRTFRVVDRRPERAVWSRPNGTSVVYVATDGRLMKRPSAGGPADDISFLQRHDDVAYHPAGTHIATTGVTTKGTYGLFLATNVGTGRRLLARGERARLITGLRFSDDGQYLYYTARHGPGNWHLHRLGIGADRSFVTLDDGRSGFEYTVSPRSARTIAWFSVGDCAEGEAGKFHARGPGTSGLDIPAELRATDLRPVGWLPGRELVVASSPVSCSTTAARDVYVLGDHEPILIVEEVGASAAVRTKVPPPPPPPDEAHEVVA